MKEIDHNSTTNTRVIIVAAALVGFGIVFNKFTEYVNRQPWGEDRSAFLVVIGVVVTTLLRKLLPFSLIWDIFAYTCSGIPMILGQYFRHYRRDQAALRRHLGQK